MIKSLGGVTRGQFVLDSLSNKLPLGNTQNGLAALFSTSSSRKSILTTENINQDIRYLEYAVRGPLVMKAGQYSRELQGGSTKLPFKSVIKANIGDCQAMNQKPITFIRQVVACAADTSLLSSSNMPNDVKERVREILSDCGGNSVGSYTDSSGIPVIRKHIAEYIEKRDGGIKCDWKNVFLSTGASGAIKSILSFINHSSEPNKPVGVMIPIPQYPLYSSTLCEFGMHQVGYYLDEDSDWRLNVSELERAYNENKDKSNIRVIAILNPGNPTGSVLTEENILEVLKFANEHNLMVLADELYQHNVWNENSKFHSFEKVMIEKTNYRIELASMT